MNGLSSAQTVSAIPRRVVVAAAYRGAQGVLRRNWSQGKINRDDLLGYLQVIDGGNGPGRGTFVEAPMRQAIVDFLAEVDRRGAVSGKPRTALNGLEGLNGFLGSVWKGVKGGVAAVIPGGAAAVGAAEAAYGVVFKGNGVDPNEGLRYGIHPDVWMQIGSGHREHVRHGRWYKEHVAKFRAGQEGLLISRSPDRFLPVGETAVSAVPPVVKPALFPPGLIQTQVSPEAARAGVMEMMQSPAVLIGLGVVAIIAFSQFGKAGR